MTKRRLDQKLAVAFKKNENFEEILYSLNNCLAVEERKLLQDGIDYFPTLHILGAPRAGTTLVSQLVLSYLPVGYINNLIAAFWKAPIYGIELSNKLLGNNYESEFKSTFGRTDNINEPHEFGYFWNYHLKYNDLEQKGKAHEAQINWSRLSKLLNNMTYHFGQPIIFKSFLFGFHALAAFKAMPKVCFIYIKRDFLSNAFSILKLRKELNGDIKEWGSIRPRQYNQLKRLSVYEQIAGQILCMEHEYLTQLRELPAENKLFFRYEDICENPNEFIEEVYDLLINHYNADNMTIKKIPSFKAVLVEENKYPKDEIMKFLKARERISEIFPELLVCNF